jgi:single-strand DNA-binding protein
MSDLNTWTVTGRLGADAELRQTANGDPVLNARVAVAGFRKDDDPLWVGVTLFGKRASALAQYLTKGTRVGVMGRAQLRDFQRRDGTSGTALELIANDVALLGGGERRDGAGHAQHGGRQAPPPAGPGGGYGDGYGDDDIPF